MKRYIIPLILILALCAAGVHSDDKKKILNQKEELKKITEDLNKAQKNLEELKQNELDIQKQLTDSDQKIRSNSTVINRLNKQLNGIKNQISQTESNIRDKQLFLDLARRRYLGNIRQFYIAAQKSSSMELADPNLETTLDKQTKYLTAVANYESSNVAVAVDLLDKTVQEKHDLTGEQKQLSNLKRKKEASKSLAASTKKRQEKNLSQIRRKQTAEADRIIMLQQIAHESEQIITRLQREAQERMIARGDKELGPSIFATLKGQLVTPYRGKITTTFGNKVDKITNLKSFSSGIEIKGNAGSKVMAVAAGTVAYVGKLRGYGNFIIINHDDRYYTTYAGLGQTYVSEKEYVLAGNKIAVSNEEGMVKFELRQGTQPLDPVEWIRIDSF